MSHICSFCKDPVPAYNKPRKAHLVIAKDTEGHIHTHGDLDRKELMGELLEEAHSAIGVNGLKRGEPPKEVVFHNRQRIGDILMFTCGVRDFKKAYPNTRVNVVSTCAHIWDHNPYVDRTLTPTDQNTVKIGPGKGTNQSNRIDWHFANAYRMSMEEHLKISIPQGESRPDIWFTREEYDAPPIFDKPYWVICITGEKSWGCKTYPFEKWQEVINQNPDLTFVQIGAREDNPPRLKGSNVIDHVGKTQDKETGIRDLFKLFLNAHGSIGLVSFHMHLSGALYKPAVVVAGAREPVSFTRFPYHQYLATDGTLPCSVPACWHCAIDKCTNLVQTPDRYEKKVPKCVEMITPDEVTRAIRRYYEGGRLELGKFSEKPKLKNIVHVPKQDVPLKVDVPPPTPKKDVRTLYGLDWGHGAIDPEDWPFLEEVIKKNQVKSVLEFGAGLSTVLMSGLVKGVSYETEEEWVQKIKEKQKAFEVRKWDGRNVDESKLGDFDMAFVDGPANGQNRDQAIRVAANHARIVIVHDASRFHEAKWQNEYLKPTFDGPIKGGKWCWMWIKTASFKMLPSPPPKKVNPKAKHIKIVSTARGWGGCSKSLTTMMKMLLDQGHSVEFIPFRNKVTSREFQNTLKNGLMDVTVREQYDAVREPCDTLLMYADDFVWEFPKPEIQEAFSKIGANKKIMMLNYRRGRVGELEWTKGWDKYMFLNSTQEKNLLETLPGVKTRVLTPCTDLSEFFKASPNYGGNLRIVRHNSQGDTKFDKKEHLIIQKALEVRKDLEIRMMPGPSWMKDDPPRFLKHARNTPIIHEFLALGNLFWYSLPEGYMDMGPRVILEAMAAGLPILADPWGGALDRVTPECGWLASKEEQLEIIKNVTNAELKKKGEAARQRAHEHFRAENWIEELCSL